MNRKVLILEFGVFSFFLNMLVAWCVFDGKGQSIFSGLDLFLEVLIATIVISIITSFLASLSAGRMLRLNKLEKVLISGWNSTLFSSSVLRMIVVLVAFLLTMLLSAYAVLLGLFPDGVSGDVALIVYVIYCGVVGMLITPVVALNRIVSLSA